ncbi:MAG: type II secretion system F family protein [Kiritimatiellae bacterium]|nr:type II secretion system F family protein [Kiritimatiellia bacterium]
MAIFRYEGVQRGKRVAGFLSQESSRAAAQALRTNHIRATRLVECKGEEVEEFGKLTERPGWEMTLLRVVVRGGAAERALAQVASLLKAGVPIMKALQLAARLSPYFIKRSLYCVANRLSGGGSLNVIMRREMPYLSNITLNLIAVGEANGTLEEMFEYAASLMEHSRKVKSELLQAMSYPCLVILAAGGAMYFMMEKVIPKILKFLTARNVPLPTITRNLITSVDFVKAYGGWMVAAPFMIAAAIYLLRRWPSFCCLMDRAMLRIPFFGKMLGSAANAMWSRTLGVLMHSGINIMQALQLTADTMGNHYLRQQFLWMQELTKQGHPLSVGARVTAISRLCPLAESMLKIGESTGLIDENLAQVARFYQEDLQRRLAMLGKMIEPAMFVVVGGMVAFVYIGFFMGLMALSKRGGQ